MVTRRALRVGAAAVVVALLLSACKSEGERLAAFRSSGEAFAAQGDLPRAIIQFRNALNIDPDDAETRIALAEAFFAQGDIRQAEQEFSVLAERFPQTLDFRSKLGEIALVSANWRNLDRHAEAALKIDPQALDAQALRLASAYRAASTQSQETPRARLAAEAQSLLLQAPAHPILVRIVLGYLANSDTPERALPVLDAALEVTPHNTELQLTRIRILAETERFELAEDRLLDLALLHPDDPQIAGLLVARHVSVGRLAEAETVLRALADGRPLNETEMRAVLVRFVQKARGPEAALEELARLRAEAGDLPAGLIYAAKDRMIRFDLGDRDDAISGMEDLIAAADDAPEGLAMRVLLAGMQDRLANRTEAAEQVARVLEEDPSNAGALKLRATWAIDEERPKDAIVDLRSALSAQPRNTELLALLAVAHDQDGNRNLAIEQLGEAAEVSGHAVEEVLRYARALLVEGRDSVALRVLDVAHQAHPQDLNLISLMAEIRLRLQDWTGVAGLVGTLRRLEGEDAASLLGPVETALHLGQNRPDQAADALARMLETEAGRAQGLARLVEGLLMRDAQGLARAQVEEALLLHPEDTTIRALRADLLMQEGELDQAETELRTLIAADPGDDAPSLRLFTLLSRQGRQQEADAVLAAGLQATPRSKGLRLIESNRLEVTGDAAGAIAILEALHSEDPSDPIIANNLAAMLTAGDVDAETLARAARIVAPMQGSVNPAISDTIGWIAYRRGNAAGALPLLERAARGLPGDAGVLLRLGQVQKSLGKAEAARATFQTVLSFSAVDQALVQEARDHLKTLGG